MNNAEAKTLQSLSAINGVLNNAPNEISDEPKLFSVSLDDIESL